MTDYTELIERLRSVGKDYDFHENALIFEAAEALEQAQARIAELEAEVGRKMSAGQYLIEQNTALALQVEQMLGNIKAAEKCLTQDPCKENAANNALAFIRANYALSTAPASEILAAHDAKVIERCMGICDRISKAHSWDKRSADLAAACRDEIGALIAAPPYTTNSLLISEQSSSNPSHAAEKGGE